MLGPAVRQVVVLFGYYLSDSVHVSQGECAAKTYHLEAILSWNELVAKFYFQEGIDIARPVSGHDMLVSAGQRYPSLQF